MSQSDVLRVQGMTCTSCEVLIERKLKTIPGIQKVTVNHRTGRCEVETDPTVSIPLSTLQSAIAEDGYTLTTWSQVSTQPNRARDLAIAGIVALAAYSVLRYSGLTDFAQTNGQALSLGTVFVVGLAAASSTCIAVVGGLVLSVSTAIRERHPDATPWQRFWPHLIFNLGRIVAYFGLGGVIGWLGQSLTPTPRLTGVLTTAIAVFMLLLAIDMLKLFPGKKWVPRMPKQMSQWMYRLAESRKPWIPLVLGALTFFVPCGFTQAMQLYALSTGSFWNGAITMGIFALGTLPALLGVGALATTLKGKWMMRFTQFAGAFVLVLGFTGVNNGLNLLGVNLGQAFSSTTNVTIAEQTAGKQVVRMAVNGVEYQPDQFKVKAGVPVEWHVDGSTASGCTSVLTVPSLKITKQLAANTDNVITFTPEEAGTIRFTCSMGMVSGAFIVEA
ncbi:MAG: heavy metal transport/detoxification protein [uncultured bacterium]|nr:MAG: heavy metal transport/detoxification protein [uncultured bacterium]HBY73261.1 hypothetical protein [Candidatus Kerfeldbacteria bacterium]